MSSERIPVDVRRRDICWDFGPLHVALLRDKHHFSQASRVLPQGAVRHHIYRSMADHLGLGLPCIRAALQRATLCNVVSPGRTIRILLNTIEPDSWLGYILHIVCAAS